HMDDLLTSIKSDSSNPEKILTPQGRDFSFLRSLFDCRIMTAAHAAALHFAGSKEAAKKRLQKLKAAGLIAERERNVNEPAVLSITAKGYDLLRDEGLLDGLPTFSKRALEKRVQVSKHTIAHELDVIDVKAAFHSAIQ